VNRTVYVVQSLISSGLWHNKSTCHWPRMPRRSRQSPSPLDMTSHFAALTDRENPLGKGALFRLKTLHALRGVWIFGASISFSFFYLTIILLFFCHGPSSPQNSLYCSALNCKPLGYTLFTPLFGQFRGTPSYMYLVPTPTGRGSFIVTSLTARSLILELLSAVWTFLYCNSIAQHVPIPFGRF